MVRTDERHIKNLLAAGRKETDGRGNVQLWNGHACFHYEEIPLALADTATQAVAVCLIRTAGNRPAKAPPDTPSIREAIRTFVGYGMGDDGKVWVAVCHHPRCYPHHWSERQIAACEVFVHGVITHPVQDERLTITALTVPGPRAECYKVCYKRTPHFFDIEVMEFLDTKGKAYKSYQIVLRCENCHHGWDLVTREGSRSRWQRLMKDETARHVLAGARDQREVEDEVLGPI